MKCITYVRQRLGALACDVINRLGLLRLQCLLMIADVIRTCLGPRWMLKMLMDPMGGVVMTNDGNAILREITVQHPATKHMIEIVRTQDEEVGDGTSSVVILAGEMLAVAEQYLEQNMHPLIIIQGYRQALDHALEALKDTLRSREGPSKRAVCWTGS
ncbi:T-complex protein 1 subunit gamma-like isoform X1 [Scylla paramamosain]|uniref:T-complex protein 1 subunit gamma-like isoform X1 n=1 Tax=Scylla paramamosain TaxID=85552 RepID=UPI003083BDDE